MLLASQIAPGLGAAFGYAALAVLATVALAFVVGRITKRYRDIDVFWPLGFVAVALTTFFSSSGGVGTDGLQRGLLLAMVSIWGLRLALHLGWRGRGEPEDPRYAAIMRGARDRNQTLYALVVIYGLQAVLLYVVSITVIVGMYASSPVRAVEFVGLGIWVLGFGFESIGDFQLERFKKNPANRGTVMNRGLWAWTRHPNYFGDATAWWGTFLVAAAGGWGLVAIMCPLLMTRLLTSVSGKPLLERRMAKTRQGFDEYVATTPAFFPRPPSRR